MNKLNLHRVEQLRKGEVVLYTGDKKGSEKVCEVLGVKKDFWSGKGNFYGVPLNSDTIQVLDVSELNNRPIHPIEWFYESSEWRKTEDENPDFGVTVIAWCRIYGTFLATYENIGDFDGEQYGNWMDFEGNLGILPPVYWMYIPTKPNY